jgi:hypothetical protein
MRKRIKEEETNQHNPLDQQYLKYQFEHLLHLIILFYDKNQLLLVHNLQQTKK